MLSTFILYCMLYCFSLGEEMTIPITFISSFRLQYIVSYFPFKYCVYQLEIKVNRIKITTILGFKIIFRCRLNNFTFLENFVLLGVLNGFGVVFLFFLFSFLIGKIKRSKSGKTKKAILIFKYSSHNIPDIKPSSTIKISLFNFYSFF